MSGKNQLGFVKKRKAYSVNEELQMCLLYFVHGRLLNQNKICRILRLSGSLKYQSQHGLKKTGAKGKFRSPDFQRLKKWFKEASSQRHQLKLFQDRKHLPTLLFSLSVFAHMFDFYKSRKERNQKTSNLITLSGESVKNTRLKINIPWLLRLPPQFLGS